MRKKFRISLLATALCALCVIPAGALEYRVEAPADYLFAQATSDSTIYEWENPNVDHSKNVALIAPGFGTATSYLPYSGEYLTPNLAAVVFDGKTVNQVGISGTTTGTVGNTFAVPSIGSNTDSSGYPVISTGSSQTVAFTQVTRDFYLANGSLGTIQIPSIGLTVGIYEGTTSTAMSKGAGHFEGTSIWNGNCCFAGHNRGVRNDFGKLHTLKNGATITLTTALGSRNYAVTSVSKVSANDTSGLTATAHNQITLYTCVEGQPAYRWCVKAVEIV